MWGIPHRNLTDNITALMRTWHLKNTTEHNKISAQLKREKYIIV